MMTTRNAQTKSSAKIKMLDQLLEDLAGDEIENDTDSAESSYFRFADDAEFSDFDNTH